jgi:glycosyltransferase involved in cell wall biosynthesis
VDSTTVIIPSYRGGRWIRRCLASLENQTTQDFRALVVDQTGDCLSAAQDFGCGYVLISRNGLGFSRNVGIGLAKTEFVAFLDVDDEWLPEKLEIQIPRTRNASYTGVEVRGPGTERRVAPAPPWDYRRWLRHRFIAVSSLAVRREILEKVGRFAEDIDPVADMDLMMRLHKAGYSLDAIPQALTVINRRPDSMSSDELLMMKHRFQAVIRNHSPAAYLWVFSLRRLARILRGWARGGSSE